MPTGWSQSNRDWGLGTGDWGLGYLVISFPTPPAPPTPPAS